MPTYEYRCKACSRELEVVQSFTDDALTTCEACGGQLRKLFGNVGIAFKGSGFYKNDSRDKAKSAAKSSESGGADKPSSDKGTGDKGSGDKATADSGSSNGKKDTGSASKPDSRGSKPATKSPAASTSSST